MRNGGRNALHAYSASSLSRYGIAAKGSFFCCRDHIGFKTFFYWRGFRRFVFASSCQAILSAADVPREVNHTKLGSLTPGVANLYPNETFFKGIYSLPSGAFAIVDQQAFRQETYWEPSIRESLIPRGDNEAFEALRELLSKAVECRLTRHSKIATLLSGGLDSSAICCVAARWHEGAGRKLTALSYVPASGCDIRLPDEREYIDEFRSWPNIETAHGSAVGRGPFDFIEDPSHFSTTPLVTSRFFVYEALEEMAISRGVKRPASGGQRRG